MPNPKETFICARCRKETASGDEAEAIAERDAMWTPREIAGGVAAICDTCFTEFTAWMNDNPAIRAMETN